MNRHDLALWLARVLFSKGLLKPNGRSSTFPVLPESILTELGVSFQYLSLKRHAKGMVYTPEDGTLVIDTELARRRTSAELRAFFAHELVHALRHCSLFSQGSLEMDCALVGPTGLGLSGSTMLAESEANFLGALILASEGDARHCTITAVKNYQKARSSNAQIGKREANRELDAIILGDCAAVLAERADAPVKIMTKVLQFYWHGSIPPASWGISPASDIEIEE